MTAPLLVDNFAGGGGASLGITRAFGAPIDIAVNHDFDALTMHEANHPETLHLREDVWQVRPRAVCRGRRVRLAWFSPDCTHHSKAKGGKPREKKIRGLCWVAVRWARDVRPDCIMLENVEEFQDYGPLDRCGHPIKARKGQLFRRFVRALERLGYTVAWRVLVAADYGAPTIRKRLYLIARCDGKPITWPEPTHAKDPGASLWTMHCTRWRGAHECIDWSLPCPSIFERKKSLAENTLRRVAEGIRRYVITCAEPFIVEYHSPKFSGDHRIRAIDEPLPTQTVENRFALVAPTMVQTGYGERSGQAPRVMDIQHPLGTVVSTGKHALVSAFIAKHFGGVVGHPMDRPLGTVTSVDHHSVVAASLCGVGGRSGQSPPRHPALPMSTVTSKADSALVQAFLTKYYGTGNGQALGNPMATVTSRDRMALVTLHGLVVINGVLFRLVDIGLRMLQPRELARAQGFPDTYVLTGTKTSQVARIGNSVCPDVAEALVRANFQDEQARGVAA